MTSPHPSGRPLVSPFCLSNSDHRLAIQTFLPTRADIVKQNFSPIVEVAARIQEVVVVVVEVVGGSGGDVMSLV